jgi:benzoate/toluate 1,2-dioxygenase beta subunit
MNTAIDTRAIDTHAIEQFLYQEAALLDRPDLDRWMELYTPDGTYWMPSIEDQVDPINYISFIYDDRVMMEIRRRNFVHPRAASKDHKVRCNHIIGNLTHGGSNEHGDIVIKSNFQAVLYYRREKQLFAGTYEHHLVPQDEGFLIRHKRVNLIDCDAPFKSLIIYL